MVVQPGSHLGPYKVLAQVGAGGMGEVWKARDTRLDRIVAIKTSSEQFSERFEREARAVAALNHPHICQLYDVGANYLVMEYIEGQPLRAPLPLEQALKYGAQICELSLSGHRTPEKFLISQFDKIHGNFSPDGHLVAYSSNENLGKYEVYVRPFPLADRSLKVSSNGGYEPRWRGDGREIYYLSEDRKLMAVSVSPGPSFGIPTPLFQTRVPTGLHPIRTNYVPSPDGRRFLVNTQTGDAKSTPITVVLNWTAGLKK